jgi:hypothetical protein
MIDHDPQHIKTAIVKWLELLEVNEKNIPSFLYSIHSTEQIPYFFYIHKIIIAVPIFIFCKFLYKNLNNYFHKPKPVLEIIYDNGRYNEYKNIQVNSEYDIKTPIYNLYCLQ